MTEYVKFPVELLDDFCMKAFGKLGFKKSECRIITDVLIMSDKFGIESHGMQRLVRYHKGIEKGLIDVHAVPEIVHETSTTAVIDAHDAMGQLAGHKAMKLAIRKAKRSGVGIVSVRNSNHFGIAGYYAKMACDEGLLGNRQDLGFRILEYSRFIGHHRVLLIPNVFCEDADGNQKQYQQSAKREQFLFHRNSFF